MSLIDRALSDPYLWGAVVLQVLLLLVLDNPLRDGYDPTPDKPIREWEELYAILHSVPLAIILAWLTKGIVPNPFTVPILGIAGFTLIFGLLISGRWFLPSFKTLQNVETSRVTGILRVAGFFTCILFGIGFGTALHVGTHPSADTLRFLYEQHINFVLVILQEFQAILGLSLAVIQPVIDRTISIYKNNAILAIKAAGLSAAGGLAFGLGIPLVLVMGMNAAIIWGVFAGILIRNSIAIGDVVFAPPLAYFASFGLPLVWHTFHEFMAIVVVGTGAGFVTLGFVSSKFDISSAGAKTVIVGFVLLAFAAFVEVWVDPQFINFVKGLVTVEPQLVPLSMDGTWAVGFASVLVTTGVFVVVTAWMVRITVPWLSNLVEELLVLFR